MADMNIHGGQTHPPWTRIYRRLVCRSGWNERLSLIRKLELALGPPEGGVDADGFSTAFLTFLHPPASTARLFFASQFAWWISGRDFVSKSWDWGVVKLQRRRLPKSNDWLTEPRLFPELRSALYFQLWVWKTISAAIALWGRHSCVDDWTHINECVAETRQPTLQTAYLQSSIRLILAAVSAGLVVFLDYYATS